MLYPAVSAPSGISGGFFRVGEPPERGAWGKIYMHAFKRAGAKTKKKASNSPGGGTAYKKKDLLVHTESTRRGWTALMELSRASSNLWRCNARVIIVPPPRTSESQTSSCISIASSLFQTQQLSIERLLLRAFCTGWIKVPPPQKKACLKSLPAAARQCCPNARASTTTSSQAGMDKAWHGPWLHIAGGVGICNHGVDFFGETLCLPGS